MLNRIIAPPVRDITSVPLFSAETAVLTNGARLHCLKNHQQPVIKLELVFKAGKWYEPAKGISYLTSKMVLEGTTNLKASQIADIVALHGASLECNQGYDRTTLTLYCLSKHLPTLLPLLQEILTDISFPEEEFKLLKQRTIQNTTVEKQKNSYLATVLLTKSIYGLAHPYITGLDEEDISLVTLAEIKDFYYSSYGMSEAEIFLSGDINSFQISLVHTYLGQVSNSSSTSGTKKVISNYNQIQNNIFSLREEKLQTSIRIGTSFPHITHPDYLKLSLMNKVLGGYFGSRLMRNIREEKGFTYGIHSALSPKENDTLFYIGTDVNYKNSEQTIEEIYKEIEELKTNLVPEEELNNVTSYSIGKYLNETTSVFDQADKYKLQIIHNLSPEYFTNYIKTLKEIKSEDIRSVAREYLKENMMVTVAVGKK